MLTWVFFKFEKESLCIEDDDGMRIYIKIMRDLISCATDALRYEGEGKCFSDFTAI